MIHRLTITLFVGLLSSGLWAQAPIQLYNPSFEDFPRSGMPPRGWYDCGFEGETPPDTQPGSFNVNAQAQDGLTFMGLVARANDTWERVSQRLPQPLEPGQCYEFSIWLMRSGEYLSATKDSNDEEPFTEPLKLRIWGGNSYCEQVELLAESAMVSNTYWKEFRFKFRPKKRVSYIQFEAFYKTPILFPYNGNLLVDNASDIVPMDCDKPLVEREDPAPLAQNQPAGRVNQKPDTSPARTSGGAASNNGDARPNPATEPRTPANEDPKVMVELDRRKLRRGDKLPIRNLYFPADSFRIKVESYPVLNEIYGFLRDNPDVTIEIGGHTNSNCAAEFCDWLSTERAKAVYDYLIKKGVSNKRLSYKGYGSAKPIAPNNTRIGRQKNQRVELTITGMSG